MNTPEEHASAVMRAPGPITVAAIAGAIRAYMEEVKGRQIADETPSIKSKIDKTNDDLIANLRANNRSASRSAMTLASAHLADCLVALMRLWFKSVSGAASFDELVDAMTRQQRENQDKA